MAAWPVVFGERRHTDVLLHREDRGPERSPARQILDCSWLARALSARARPARASLRAWGAAQRGVEHGDLCVGLSLRGAPADMRGVSQISPPIRILLIAAVAF